MKKYRIIIAGSRTIPETGLALFSKISTIIKNLNKEDIEIVSGGARGADKLGENFAELHGLSLKVFPADWNKLGKKAGMVRNSEMANYATHLIAIWDGESRGTKHMIEVANKKGLKVRVISI